MSKAPLSDNLEVTYELYGTPWWYVAGTEAERDLPRERNRAVWNFWSYGGHSSERGAFESARLFSRYRLLLRTEYLYPSGSMKLHMERPPHTSTRNLKISANYFSAWEGR